MPTSQLEQDSTSHLETSEKEKRVPIRLEYPDRNAIVGGFAITVILHLLLWLIVPKHIKVTEGDQWEPLTTDAKVVFEAQVEQKELNYVETNPDVPENPPDDTKNFAARDQQSSQENPAETLSPDNTPQVDGDMKDSNRIISGELSEQPVPDIQPGQQTPQTQPQYQPQPYRPPAQPSLPSFIEQAPEQSDGIASALETGESEEAVEYPQDSRVIPLVRTPAQEPSEQMQQQNQVDPLEAQQAQQGQPIPRPRPRVARTTRGPLLDNPSGAISSGFLAIDAQSTEFGNYLQRMFEAIGRRWDDLNAHGMNSISATGNSYVIIKFNVNKQGQIEQFRVVETTANKIAEEFCVQAIKGSAPFWPWTPDMVEILGDSQPVTTRFFYR